MVILEVLKQTFNTPSKVIRAIPVKNLPTHRKALFWGGVHQQKCFFIRRDMA